MSRASFDKPEKRMARATLNKTSDAPQRLVYEK
jgi:hypothetical protein